VARSTLVAVLSYFLEMKSELDLIELGSPRVPGCRQACLSVSWCFRPKMQAFGSVKGVCEDTNARDRSSLADLRPTHRVALCRWLVGITLPKNKVHTFFSKSWA
jgi:hypothetical protein